MEKFLREWRQDALNKAQYESAIFIGDKLLALTKDDKDAFWLAQVHFATGNYTRAQSFLAKQDLITRNPACRYLAGHCLIKQGRFDEAMTVLGERPPAHLLAKYSCRDNNRHKRMVGSGPGVGALGAWNSHTHSSLLESGGGDVGRGSNDSFVANTGNRVDLARICSTTSGSSSSCAGSEEAANRRYEAAICYLRGICYAKRNAFDKAKESYKQAVQIDVQCLEAFQQLMKNSLMSPTEEWAFLEGLDFDSIEFSLEAAAGGDGETPAVGQEASEFTRMLYTTRLSKYRNLTMFTNACDTLATHYNMAHNADLLLARADLLYTQCRYKDAMVITEGVLRDDKYNFSIYPLHLACLYELGKKNVLFLVAHDLADTHPEEPCAWLAVATYYFAVDKIAEARRYFSKASMMDAHFGPAWIGFAHTFAAEGEHDQAISAYSTAARLFMGTHLPQVFLGMQNLALNNLTLAEEFFRTAYGLCKTDTLLLNEMGVVLYHTDRLQEAVQMFREAVHMAEETDSEPGAWLGTKTNLGHAYRRLGDFEGALEMFDEVLRLGGKDDKVFLAKGLCLLELDRPCDAISVLHEALAMMPQDPMATDLLNKALDETVDRTFAQRDVGDTLTNEMVLDNNMDGEVVGDNELENNFDSEILSRERRVAEQKMKSRLRELKHRGFSSAAMVAGTDGSGANYGDEGDSRIEEDLDASLASGVVDWGD